MQVGSVEAKVNLAKLVDRARSGEEIIITRHRVPVARLAPLILQPKKRKNAENA